jgi:hypothetical protein
MPSENGLSLPTSTQKATKSAIKHLASLVPADIPNHHWSGLYFLAESAYTGPVRLIPLSALALSQLFDFAVLSH